MEQTQVRLSGTRQHGTEIQGGDDSVTVTGITDVRAEEFEVVVQFQSEETACDALLHVLEGNRSVLFSDVLPDNVVSQLRGSGQIDSESVSVDATTTSDRVAYTLAKRVAGRNQSDEDILGETATSVEGILLDFAMGRRGQDIDGLSAAARSALLTYVISERSSGDTTFQVADLSQ